MRRKPFAPTLFLLAQLGQCHVRTCLVPQQSPRDHEGGLTDLGRRLGRRTERAVIFGGIVGLLNQPWEG